MILDEQVPTADPGELIIQYTSLIYKIAKRYESALDRSGAVDQDDLLQVGRLAVYNCQKTYDPDGGATFMSYAFDKIRNAMRRVLGFKADGTLPKPLASLDEPLTEDSDETYLDFVPDKTPTAEERIVEQDGHQETADAVRAAVDRLKNEKQRTIITRCWLYGESNESVAADLGMSASVCRNIDLQARYKLRRDKELKAYAALQYPTMRIGAGRFRSTWTSATEAAVLWRERRFDGRFGDGAFAGITVSDLVNHDPGNTVATW